jgi:hypothetical protein
MFSQSCCFWSEWRFFRERTVIFFLLLLFGYIKRKVGILLRSKKKNTIDMSSFCTLCLLEGCNLSSRSFGCVEGEKDGTLQNMHETSNHTQPVPLACGLSHGLTLTDELQRATPIICFPGIYSMTGLSFLEMPRPSEQVLYCVYTCSLLPLSLSSFTSRPHLTSLHFTLFESCWQARDH